MGVHTWTSKRVNRTLDEARELAIKNLSEKIEKYASGKLDKSVNSVCSHTHQKPEYVKKDIIWMLEQQLEAVKAGIAMYIWDNQPEELSKYVYHLDGFFVEVGDYHNCFRTGESEVFLSSKEDCLQFLNLREYVNPESIDWDSLNEFWENYPDGIIETG